MSFWISYFRNSLGFGLFKLGIILMAVGLLLGQGLAGLKAFQEMLEGSDRFRHWKN